MNKWIFKCLCVLPLYLAAQPGKVNWNKPNFWVDSVFNTLTEDEKIGQLFMVDVWSMRDSQHFKEVEVLIKEYKVGGLIFFKGHPYKQATLCNQFQSKSKIPLLIGIDGEWGLSMRLDSTPVYPRQMALGASANEKLVYQMGASIGAQCKRMGIHFNFAPDVDVNNNPNNPVINDRSFGENREVVSKLGAAYARGLQDMHVMASAKHFPGHGDTETDSHYGLPVIKCSRERLDSLELFPFKKLINEGVMSVMVAHLNIPALDTANTPSSLSKPIITDLLRKELGFEGIIITDALNMKGVADLYPPGEVAVKALQAGNDILLFVENVPLSIQTIKKHLLDSTLQMEQINQSVKRILLAKYWAGLSQYEPIELVNLTTDLNSGDAPLMIKKATANSVVVAKNIDEIIPIKHPENFNIACIAVGIQQVTYFQEYFLNYAAADLFSIDKTDTEINFDSLLNVLEKYNLVVISLHATSRYASKKLGLTQPQIDFINKLLAKNSKHVLVCNGNPYILTKFQTAKNVIVAYEDLELNNLLAAEVLFGAIQTNATMPVSAGQAFKLGTGNETELTNRVEYVIPQELGYDQNAFYQIDSIANSAIENGATPGCQIWVAQHGKVIYNKSFGYHDYDKISPVKNYHLYDLASLTKVLATTLAVMKLYENHLIKLDDKLVKYLPELEGSNKENITIFDVLTHQAGLQAFIPMYKHTLIKGNLNPLIYSNKPDSFFCIPVANNLYMHKEYEPFVWKTIIDSDVKPKGAYLYSDLGFILLRKVVEKITHASFDSYLQQTVYKPLNLSTITFNPLGKCNLNWVIPTEADSLFRKQLCHGTVHDQTAAMLGGVSGHAGLFANANDVGILMQMLINKGEYAGVRVFKESTVNQFIKRQTPKNRRGLGFDKPETEYKKPSPASKLCSPQTFGHTGFTGTCTWADPKHGIVYVFLSNRVNPSADNKKLVDYNVRTNIQDVVYRVLLNGK